MSHRQYRLVLEVGGEGALTKVEAFIVDDGATDGMYDPILNGGAKVCTINAMDGKALSLRWG